MKMKHNRLFAGLLAFVMVFAMAVPVVYAQTSPTKTSTVTVHKLLMDKATMGAWDPNGPAGYDGTQDLTAFRALLAEGVTVSEIAGVYFAWQNESGQWIDGSGTVVDSVDQALGALTGENGIAFDTSSLPQEGPTKYKIVEVREKSTYVGPDGETLSDMLAVPVEITLPLVNNDGIQENVHVYPKNTEVGKPDHNKTLGEGASTELQAGQVDVGGTVPYKVTTTIKAGSTYNKIAWTDRLSDGLKYNRDLTITAKYTENSVEQTLTLTEGTHYTLTETDNSFVLNLTDDGLAEVAKITAPTDAGFKVNGAGDPINGKNLDLTFTLTYSAEVLETALINNPLENTNTLHYGNNPGYTPEPGDNEPPEFPNVTEINVDKSFTNGPLASSDPTTWPDGLEITLKLQVYNPVDNSWSDVTGQTLTLNSTTTSGKFENLDASKVYKVVEVEVEGWVPNYSIDETTGNLVIVNKKNDNPPPITTDPVTVRTGEKKFVKTNLDGSERLAGAEFIVGKNVGEAKKYLALKDTTTQATEIAAYEEAEANYIAAVDAYNAAVAKGEISADNPVVFGGQTYETAAAAETAINGLKVIRDNAYKAMNMQWTWVDDKANAFVFTTNQDGQWSVYGLAYGTYFYEEITPPAGYAAQPGEVSFEVNATSNTTGNIDYVPESTKLDATQITNKKVTIPQTGGIGTLIFTAAGIALMGGAAFAMKRRSDEEEA